MSYTSSDVHYGTKINKAACLGGARTDAMFDVAAERLLELAGWTVDGLDRLACPTDANEWDVMGMVEHQRRRRQVTNFPNSSFLRSRAKDFMPGETDLKVLVAAAFHEAKRRARAILDARAARKQEDLAASA
ncbi:hypothetical protein JNJ66_00760 [Candidatus Saccharibacteria bacterium]|nr:hypothetical protein [Candidatus Saccharibacteria bacterium]